MHLYSKFLLITLISNTAIYTVTIYFYYLIKLKYDLLPDELAFIMQLNTVGIFGNIFFSFLANKYRIHKIICASLIFMHALFFVIIKLISHKNYAKYIMIGNALSAGGFNPVFDSYFLNYIRSRDLLSEIGRQRQFISLGAFFSGFLIFLLNLIFKDEQMIAFVVCFLCGLSASALLLSIDYEYIFFPSDKSTSITLTHLLEEHLTPVYFLLYFSIGLFGFFKLLFTNIQRNLYISMGISSESTTLIKSLGNLFEFFSYFIFHHVNIESSLLFFLGIFFNVARLVLFIFFRMNFTALFFLEIHEKITFMIYAISLNRILNKLSSSYLITFSHGLRYFFFFLMGSFLSGFLIQKRNLDFNGPYEEFQNFFSALLPFALLLFLLSTLFIIFYRNLIKI